MNSEQRDKKRNGLLSTMTSEHHWMLSDASQDRSPYSVALSDVVNKGQNPLHQFPRSKSVTSWRGQKSVVSVVSCRFRNSITTTQQTC